MKDSVVLILGASHDQRYLFETARRMNCHIIGIDMNPNAPCLDMADEKAIISTRDLDELLSFARAYHRKRAIHAVVTMGSEIPMTIATLSEALDLQGISRDTARLASDKLAMKRCWAEKGIPIPWFDELRSGSHLRQLVKERGWNLIVKPTDRSGARGITRLAQGMDCDAIFNKAKEASYEGHVIVEEFLPGAQESTESIVYDSFFITAGVSDRNYDMTDLLMGAPIENGGTMPSDLPTEKLKEVDQLLESAARALGITRGVAKGDVALDADGKPRMIEMAARLSGGWMSSGLIPLTSGVNIVETILEISLGRLPELKKLQPQWKKHAALRYFFPREGHLKQIDGFEQVSELPWVRMVEFYKKIGERIGRPASHADRTGGFLVEGNSRQEVLDRSACVYNRIKIITERE